MFILAFHVHSCDIQCKSLDNPHEFSQILHHWKEDELLYQEYVRFIWIHLESNDSHDSANPDNFPIRSNPQT